MFEPSGYGLCGAVQMSSAVLLLFCRVNFKIEYLSNLFYRGNNITIIIVVILSQALPQSISVPCAPTVNSGAPLRRIAPPRLGTTAIMYSSSSNALLETFTTCDSEREGMVWDEIIHLKCIS